MSNRGEGERDGHTPRILNSMALFEGLSPNVCDIELDHDDVSSVVVLLRVRWYIVRDQGPHTASRIRHYKRRTRH